MKCSVDGCSLDTFENENKCIFHCEKTKDNGWILGQNDEEVDNRTSYLYYKWNKKYLNIFWSQLKEHTQNSYNRNKTTISCVEMSDSPEINLKPCFHINNFIVPAYSESDIFSYGNEFGKYTFLKSLFIDNFFINRNYDDSEEYSSVCFHGCTFMKSLKYFRYGLPNQRIEISESNINDFLEIDGEYSSVNLSKIEVRDLKIGNIFFTKTELKNLSISSLNAENITLSRYKSISCSIKEIEINNKFIINDTFLDDIFIRESIINKLEFINLTVKDNSNIYLEDLKINFFNLEKLNQNSNKIQFNHFYIKEKMSLKKADLSNSVFNDFDISSAKKEIEKTSLYDAKLNSVNWGNISKIDASKDIFRQLKFVNDKQSNYIDANSFYSMEMKKHKEDLKKYSWFSNHWQEKCIFLLNEKISNFGQSWFMVILWIITFNLTFFSMYKLSKIDLNVSNIFISLFVIIILFIVGLGLKEKFGNQNLSLHTIPYIFLIGAIIFNMSYFQIGNINELIEFTSFKLKESDTSKYLIFWMVNKSIFGFLAYHLVISLRRQTRR